MQNYTAMSDKDIIKVFTQNGYRLLFTLDPEDTSENTFHVRFFNALWHEIHLSHSKIKVSQHELAYGISVLVQHLNKQYTS